jgi:hypothetical protein
LNGEAALADYTTPWRYADRVPAGLALSDATPAAPPPMQRRFKRHFRSIQGVSDLNSGLLASHLDIVALRIASKSELKERISDD